MWTDIDYMNERHVFTLDPQRFPLEKMRELVNYLHQHQQHYIVMVDPAVAYDNYSAFNNGANQGIFLKVSNGSIYEGVVWPGPTAFPDWFNPDTQTYWSSEFDSFFNADTGLDIDALWIDMNEASNFCNYPCSDPAGFAKANGYVSCAVSSKCISVYAQRWFNLCMICFWPRKPAPLQTTRRSISWDDQPLRLC